MYGIAYGRSAPGQELVSAAKDIAITKLGSLDPSVKHYSVGFLGIHQGRTSNFVFIDWWADENELHHHVYVSPIEEPANFSYKTPTGLIACTWDLRVLAFERDAWVQHVLKQHSSPDIEAYLNAKLKEDI